MQTRTCKTYTLVQIAVCNEFSGLCLGQMGLELMSEVMEKYYKVDLLSLSGCVKRIYDQTSWSNEAEWMKGRPFLMSDTRKEDVALFYYKALAPVPNPKQKKALGGKSKFEKNVLDHYRSDPMHNKFRVGYDDQEVNAYYGTSSLQPVDEGDLYHFDGYWYDGSFAFDDSKKGLCDDEFDVFEEEYDLFPLDVAEVDDSATEDEGNTDVGDDEV